MPAEVYKILHLVGIMLVFLSLGGALVRSMSGNNDAGLKKLTGISNGVGMLIILVTGFGLIAKLKTGFPGWVIAKMVLWVVFGFLLSAALRKPELGKKLWFVIILLGAVAAWLGVMKPF
jgi:hypothetical protein